MKTPRLTAGRDSDDRSARKALILRDLSSKWLFADPVSQFDFPRLKWFSF